MKSWKWLSVCRRKWAELFAEIISYSGFGLFCSYSIRKSKELWIALHNKLEI